jgi:hypothetical protein
VPHLFEMATPEEIAATDPFEGRGVFLACDSPDPLDILRIMNLRLGRPVAALAWAQDGIRGAWVDTGEMPDAARRWRESQDGSP